MAQHDDLQQTNEIPMNVDHSVDALVSQALETVPSAARVSQERCKTHPQSVTSPGFIGTEYR